MDETITVFDAVRMPTQQNWSNKPAQKTLPQCCAEIDDAYRARTSEYVQRIGLEVVGLGDRADERWVLVPAFCYAAGPALVGNVIRCSGLGLTSEWRIVAVVTGYPLKWHYEGEYTRYHID